MANTTNRVAGTAYLSVDGVSYALVGELEYSPASFKRESAVGQDRIHGYKEVPTQPHIAGTIRDMNGLSVAALNGMTNVTVTLQLANGKLVIGRNMWTVESQTSKTLDATVEVRWEGLQGAVTEN
jgi:hypothetical protein